ncbi:FlaA1/EpsC-like NDP-sugar epimerase [Halanaerobium saccharolyticum]|uniref:FlaA1/EpsC-like NDP-sugar epimerase n=1 Tax=Halanaerobium saccharolyticum TaxID=43595 RepID=A0A4R7Z6M3_9FIRM|nr:nucleoside-diphosphate sugar epimerase/dehydratase [Halanaerobium saccharolyticum]RAK12537.1 FlaA1/EpsC-like NDP-sugar epimerase [Halanaerobium saccharolyticum]TDW06463.1 FlaA1/EpsC-like NDP-sugar epimerase [Halanaerobium saccharolyticum]TDX61711.1 FlaA1/EpsC-like NDP-sugar epimerase [Halanaerobium saccharolyticum]
MIEYLLKLYKKPRLIIIDLALVNLAVLFSFILRFDEAWMQYFRIEYLLAITVISFFVLYFSALYNKMWQYASMSELYSIFKATIVINIIFVIYIYFFRVSFPRSIIAINLMSDIFLLGGMRFGLRLLKDHLNRNQTHKSQSRVLIIGAGDAAEMIIREMQKHPEIGKRIVGLVDDDPAKQSLEIHGNRVLGKSSKIPQLIEEYDVDEVIIAIPSADGKTIKRFYELSNKKEVKVEIVPGVYEILKGDVSLNQIREVKVEDLLRRDQVDLITDEISDYLQDKTVLVSGGGGSIGSELCRQVAKFNPKKIIIFDINENTTYFLERDLRDKYPNLDLVSIIGSIRDKNKLEKVFGDHSPDVVFHAAAHKHVPLMETSPEEAIKNNILGTRNLAETAAKFKIDRFVLISTDKAVNPTNVMGASKRAAEMVVQTINKKSETKFMAVRFGNVLGSQGSVIPLFKKQIADGGPLTVTHKDITRYFMTIPEASQLVIQAGALGKGGEVFVLDMGEPVKIMELAEDLISLSGLTPYEDIDIEVIGLRPGEKLYEELLCDTEDNLPTEHERIFINNLEAVDQEFLNKHLKRLTKLAEKSAGSEIVAALVDLVETYQPRRDNVKKIDFKKDKKSS